MNLIWHKRLFNPSRFIRIRKIYILPTLSGMKLFAVNLLLLIVGLIFANNFVLFFDFLLFGLFVCSMFYTHFNLDQIELISTRFIPGHSGEYGQLYVMLKNNSQLNKTSVTVALPKTSHFAKTSFPVFDLAPHELREVSISLKLKERGVENFKRWELNTVYPFNFFRSFTYAEADVEMIVYPARDFSMPIKSWPITQHESYQSEEDLDLIKYEHGKSLSRVFWKRFALTGEMYSRYHSRDTESMVQLDWNDIQESSLERKLVIMTSAICYFDERSMAWEANINGQLFQSKHKALKSTLSYLAAMK